MPYDPDPLQRVTSKRFRRDGDLILFEIEGLAGALPVTDEDVFNTEESLRTYSRLARFAGIVVIGAASLIHFVPMVEGRPFVASWLTSVAIAVAISVLMNLLALKIAFGPLKRRLIAYQKQQRGWKPKGLNSTLSELGVSPIAFGIAALCMLFFTSEVLIDIKNRYQIRDHGIAITGNVIRSKLDSKSKCRVEYNYKWAGQEFSGEELGCELMYSHPVGSSITVSIAPDNPGYAMLPGERPWTGDQIFLAVLVAIWGAVLMLVFKSAKDYAPPE